METLDIVFWILSIALSLASLIAMIFGIRLGRKAMTKNITLYGVKAVEQYAFLKDHLLKGKDKDMERYPDGGGRLTTPQLRIEKLTYDRDTMPKDWKRYTKRIRFYDMDNGNPPVIQVEEWKV